MSWFDIKLVFALTAQRAARTGQDGGAAGLGGVMEKLRWVPDSDLGLGPTGVRRKRSLAVDTDGAASRKAGVGVPRPASE